MTDYKKYFLSRKETLTFCLFWFSGAMIIGNLFYESLAAGLLLTLPAWPARKGYGRYLAACRLRELSYQFRDLLYSLSASVAAGHQMGQALTEAEGNLALIYGEDTPIRKELNHIVYRMKESRESEENLLRDLGIRSGLSDIRDFSEVYSICRQTGGGLEEAIAKASEVLMDKIDLKREIHTLTAQKKLETRMLLILPVLMISLLRVLSPGYLNVMYQTAEGRLIMTLTLVGIGFAAFLTMKLTRIEL